MKLKESELILNSDGSIYHLNLLPDELADTVILVGDPDRVEKVSSHFDSVEIKKSKREFVTHTGVYQGKRMSVVSTGIGVGSIDIVLNELDALKNIDFKAREVKDQLTQLSIVRLGTCGGLSEALQLHDLVYSCYAVGFDGLLSFYRQHKNSDEMALEAAVQEHFHNLKSCKNAYPAKATWALPMDQCEVKTHVGMTLTCPGFYGPQQRQLRLPLIEYDFWQKVRDFRFKNYSIYNFEMETSGILALGSLLGHRCASISTIVANRVTREFSPDSNAAIEAMVCAVLKLI